MAGKVEFFFDVGSPSAYLAWTQLPGIARETEAELVYRPVLLGGIFRSVGNVSPAEIPPKSEYLRRDLARFAGRYGVPLRYNSAFPINTLGLMRGAVAAEREGVLEAYLGAVFPAIWVHDADLSDPANVAACLREGGLDADRLIGLAGEAAAKDGLRERSDAAVRRGLFGVPSMFVGDSLFFGQDRLDFVREALAA